MGPCLAAVALLVCTSLANAQQEKVIRIHQGKHWVWYCQEGIYDEHKQDVERFYDYADRAFDYLASVWGMKPPLEKYSLLVLPRTGIAFATGDIGEVREVTGKESPGIGVCHDAFFNVANDIKGYWAYALTTHEMVNLFTGSVVSGGWPVDWWANHRSPFPAMTAVQVEFALIPEVAVHHGRQFAKDELYGMFVRLKDQFGWSLFRQAFTAARKDGINWEWIGENPSPLRTSYVCAYLQLAVPTDLSEYFKEGGVPDFDKGRMLQVIAARKKWHDLPSDDASRASFRDAYLHGRVQD
jgi:hypothetical protein